MNAKKTLHWFRIIAMTEGISFLVLLGIAMPLKYFANLPMAVRIVGMLHGILFVAFIVLAWETMSALNKKFGWFVRAFIASIIPFGTFVLEKELKKEALLIK
jgi:integral membrane protein